MTMTARTTTTMMMTMTKNYGEEGKTIVYDNCCLGGYPAHRGYADNDYDYYDEDSVHNRHPTSQCYTFLLFFLQSCYSEPQLASHAANSL